MVEGGEYREVGCGGHSMVEMLDTVRLMWRTQRGWDAGHGAVGCGELGMGEIKMVGEVDCEVCFGV